MAAAALTAGTSNVLAEEPALPTTPYMGGPVELVEAPTGAIANKRILEGIELGSTTGQLSVPDGPDG